MMPNSLGWTGLVAMVVSLMSSRVTVGGVTVGEDPPALEVWAADPLVKVFRDDPAGAVREAAAEVARGEHAALQIVVRSSAPISGLRAAARPLELDGDPGTRLAVPPARFVGYVPVDRPIQDPPKDQLRKPPADFPDPLLEADALEVGAGQNQPVWLTVPVPAEAKAGLYRGAVELSGRTGDMDVKTSAPVSVRVYPATARRNRLWVTNWFAMHWPHMQIDPKAGSSEYWALLRRYARNMAEHRQNVALISPLGLASFDVSGDGKLTVDLSTFDRWVEIFTEEGVIGRIEGGHLGGRSGGWESPFVIPIRKATGGHVESASVDPSSAEADRFYAWFLPALVRHLEERGWIDKYLQHLADEPIASNAAGYRSMAALVRKHAPKLRIVEACHTKDLVGAIDVWVPQLNFLHRDLGDYRKRQEAGEEVWFYTCVFPQGEYANRFIEQPLSKTRLLHWINFRYGVTGYLHWGYNHWTADSPFTHTTRAHPGPPYLPAGDAWIVYPGRDGPLDSIRHEAMRDGIADHELLSQLAERDREAAMRLASRLVLDFDRYDCGVEAFRSTRRELLELSSKP